MGPGARVGRICVDRAAETVICQMAGSVPAGGFAMKQNVRFVVTIILMVAAVAAVWWLLFRPESETPSTGNGVTRRSGISELPLPAPPPGLVRWPAG